MTYNIGVRFNSVLNRKWHNCNTISVFYAPMENRVLYHGRNECVRIISLFIIR